MKKTLPIIIIIAVSAIVHFAYFGHPNETVFDEVHFGKFISGYFTHEYFFDIHPPLGKLLISGMGYLGGFKPGFSFAEIGQKFPDQTYLWLRFLPTLAGVLLPLVIYWLMLELGLSQLASFSAALLVALDGAILVQSLFILLDSSLLLFGFSSLLFYFKYKKNSQIKYLVLAGLSSALAVSVKWTGATILAVIIILEIIEMLKKKQKDPIQIAQKLVFLIAVPFIIYFAIFAVHLKLLTKSGPGDAFMTAGFQKTLIGNVNQKNPEIKDSNLFRKFIELNTEMYQANATLNASHPYGSQWYTWPFMIRPIYYWYGAGLAPSPPSPVPAYHRRIYFIGNAVIWWLAAAAVIYALITFLTSWLKIYTDDESKKFPLIFLLGGYLLNLLPFIQIKRVMFLYHYMIALIFAIMILVCYIDRLKNRKKLFTALIAISIAVFAFFAPLYYGLPLTDKAYNARVWFPSWR